MDTIARGFEGKKVLLIGDAIIDMYIHGLVVGQALGTTVPRIEEKTISYTFGGNGLVAANMLELGGIVHFVTILGDDDDAKRYEKMTHKNLKKYFFVDPSRRTTVKGRIFGDGVRLFHLNRVDHHYIGKSLEDKIMAQIKKLMPNVDRVVIMDPQHGMLSPGLVKKVQSIAKKLKKPITVDAQVSHRSSNHAMYAGVDTMILNEKEAKAANKTFNSLEPKKSLLALKKKFSLENVIVKLGEQGSLGLFGTTLIQTPGYQVRTVDAWGAGDAFLAAFSLADYGRLEESLNLANMWAALSTTIAGTTPPKLKELLVMIRKYAVVK